MKRIVIGALLLAAAAIAVWYWWPSVWPNTPSITITSPAGGEQWQPGEERVISWNANNIPSSDKISVTIRRIPPPPLPEEGQEFDPVVLINLPNTGSTTWKISPMYPDGTYVLGLQAYESIPITNGVSAESAAFTITHPKLSADLYPLYAKADWSGTEAERFTIGTTSYSGTSVSSAPVSAGMNPGSIITPFSEYYDKKLKALGWSVANDLAAGGHVGGQTGYRKGGNVVLTRFHIDYQTKPENAPSECPCNVTLSLFSTGE